jgi:Na+/melibiose symporter-like transporter
MYVPVENIVSGVPKVSVAYFTFWFMMLYLAMTLFEVPHSAWASELALTSTDKAKIFSFRSIAGFFGMFCFYLIPLLPIFDTQDITPATLKVSVISAGFVMLPLLYICIKNTPNGSSLSAINTDSQLDAEKYLQNKFHFRALCQSIFCNKPLLIFFSAFLAYGFGIGMWYSLVFLYVDIYLDLGEYFAQVFLLSFAAGIIITPILCKLAIILGKKIILSVAMILLIISFISAAMLTPGEAGFRELLILQIINALGGSCMVTFAPAMLSEIIDYNTWKYRIESTATYYALYMFLGKFNIAVGGALGLAIAGWYGLDATATEQTSEGIVGLMIGITWLPIIFTVIALVLIILSPINIRRHGIIRRCLDARVIRVDRDAVRKAPHANISTSYLTQTGKKIS